MATNRKCIVCPDKHHYKYYSNCSGYNSKETWRYLYCSENCRSIYDIATRFSRGKITELEAKKELENYDLTDLEFYNPTIKKEIKDILSYEEIVEKKENEEIFIPQFSNSNDDNMELSSTSVSVSSVENNEVKIEPRKKKYKKNDIVNVD